ncbi:MAG: hypothetical protein DRI71_08995 [Bacteroidetes bacterium]|nr:MAG: hypothetical protein DRI71_08995 [Bacteroidota bacterium]
MTRKKKSIKEIEGAEYGVNSIYTSRKEKKAVGKVLMEARLQRMKNVSADHIIQAKLLQLKLKMEDYIKKPVYEDHNFFTEFLRTYIDTIYSRRNNFAKDINITPIRLSQVLNNHRDPKEEFILRLMIHSEKTYKNVCQFHKKTWYQVYFHEKICDTMSSQDEWRPGVEKHVNISKLIKA